MGKENKGAPGGAPADHPRREDLEYYEVDLRDYLRVLWRGKWIVLFCTLLAVGIAAFISFRSPDIYRVGARLSVEEIPIPGITEVIIPPSESETADYFVFSPVSAAAVVEWTKDSAVIERVVTSSGVNVSPGWISGHLTAKASETFVDLALEGSLPPADLVRLLEGVIEALKERAQEAVREALTAVTTSLEAKRRKLEARKAAWEKELQGIKARTESQRDAILARIEALAAADVPVGETVMGYRMRKELDLLYERLAQVELLLDEIERLGIGALPGAAKEYVLLEGELAELSTQKTILDALLEDPPASMTVLRGPQVPTAPVGPKRKTNIAVAGVLGIFVGVLGAFVGNFLREGVR